MDLPHAVEGQLESVDPMPDEHMDCVFGQAAWVAHQLHPNVPFGAHRQDIPQPRVTQRVSTRHGDSRTGVELGTTSAEVVDDGHGPIEWNVPVPLGHCTSPLGRKEVAGRTSLITGVRDVPLNGEHGGHYFPPGGMAREDSRPPSSLNLDCRTCQSHWEHPVQLHGSAWQSCAANALPGSFRSTDFTVCTVVTGSLVSSGRHALNFVTGVLLLFSSYA